MKYWGIGQAKTDTGEIEWGNQPDISTTFFTLQYSSIRRETDRQSWFTLITPR
jgi:hypothetical protein